MCCGDNEGQQQFGNEVAQPDCRRLGKPDLADGYQPPGTGKEHSECQQVDQRSLTGFSKVHLQRATEHGDRCDEEQADLNDALTGVHGDVKGQGGSFNERGG